MRVFMISFAALFALVALTAHEANAYAPPPPPHVMWHGPHGYWHGNRYVIENPILAGLPIRIANPAANTATLSYVLNGTTYSIAPGYSQDLTLDRPWVITFSRGGTFGEARYGLESGLYSFAKTDHGWELYHGALAQPAVVPAPVNPPVSPAPTTATSGTLAPPPAPVPTPATPAPPPSPAPTTPATTPAPTTTPATTPAPTPPPPAPTQ